MNILKKQRENKVVWLLTVCMITSFTVFESYSWGKIILLGIGVLIYFISYRKNRRLVLPYESYQRYFIVFIMFTFLSSVWALKPSDAIEKGITLTQILIIFSMLYLYYRDNVEFSFLLSAIKWAGYLVALYTIYYFGLNVLMSSVSANRLANEFSNVNSIGLICALACVIQIQEILYKKLNWEMFFVLPCILVISATQSRKAFIFLAIGGIALYYFKNKKNGLTIKSILGIVIGICILIVIYLAITKMPIFSGLYNRVQMMLYYLNGTGTADHSTVIRNEMVHLGIEWWKKYPIGGIGMGCPHIIVNSFIGKDHYLHNNYVELLCGGGMIGFCLYYFFHGYILVNLYKYRKTNYRIVTFSFIWVLLILFMDYGMVSYYSKNQWFYLMTLFLGIRFLKRGNKR